MKYNSKYGLYKIDTTFWGTDIADIELVENTDYCFTDCYAIFRVYLYQDISSNKKNYKVDFENILTSNAKFNNYNLSIKTNHTKYWKEQNCINWKNETYTNYTAKGQPKEWRIVCNQYETVMKNKTITKYVPMSFNDLSNLPIGVDNYIKLSGTKKINQNLDWKITFYDYKLHNWAWWNSSYDYRRNATNVSSNNPGLIYPFINEDPDNDTLLSNYYGVGDFYYTNDSLWDFAYNGSQGFGFSTKEDGARSQIVKGTPPVSLDIAGYVPIDYVNGWNAITNVNGTVEANVNINDSCIIGACANFTDGNINTGYNVNGLPQLSISSWIYPKQVSSQAGIVSAYSGSGARPMIYSLDNGKLKFYPGATSNSLSTKSINVSEWTHVVMVFGSSRISFFINGVLDSNQSTNSNLASQNSNLYIGSLGTGRDENFTGLIDDVRFYNRTLKAKEVEAIFNMTGAYLGTNETNVTGGAGASWIKGNISNLTQSYYKDNELLFDIWVNSTHDYNYTLYF